MTGVHEGERQAALREAATAIAEGRTAHAASALDRLLDGLSPDGPGDDLTFFIYATALARRIDHRPANQNLYLRDLNLAQISLFNLLATYLPIVHIAGALANETLAGLLADRERAVLLDLGIGTGQQEVGLLRELASRNRLPGALHVVAVEPSGTSLSEAEQALRAVTSELDVAFSFTGVEGLAEELSDVVWDDLRREAAGGIANAAFALHHVTGVHETHQQARERVLHRLAELEPVAVVLCEPHAGHMEPDFGRRFDNCWSHFSTVFRLIDSLDLPAQDRIAMKFFFAREIDDILANDEATRAERHEWTEVWRDRLTAAGMVPAFPVAVELPDGPVHVVPETGAARIAFEDTTLVSVLTATRTASLEAAGWVDSRPAPGTRPAPSPARLTVSRGRSSRLKVRDVMTQDVVTIRLGTPLHEAAALLHETATSDLAVIGPDGAFVGVLSEGDLIRTLLPRRDGADAVTSMVEEFELLGINGRVRALSPLDPLVITEAIVLEPSEDLLRAADVMVTRQIRRLPVVEGGRLVGSLSRADLVRALLQV